MGVGVFVAFWTRVKVLPSSLFLAHRQSAHFLFMAVFHALDDLKKVLKLYMSCIRIIDLSMAVKNTSIGFKMRQKLKLESNYFSIS